MRDIFAFLRWLKPGETALNMNSLSSSPFAASKPPSHDHEPVGDPKYELKDRHMIEMLMTRRNWYQNVNWLNLILIVGVPTVGLIIALWSPVRDESGVFATVYYFVASHGRHISWPCYVN